MCGAAVFKYSDVNWYRNDVLMDPNIQIVSKNTEFSLQKIMHWNKFTESSMGNYTCRAKNKETGKNETIDFALHAIHPKKPTINESNFNDESEWIVEQMKEINLTCDFSGIPQPELNWYKYENDKKHDINASTDPNRISLKDAGKMLFINVAKEEDKGKYVCEAKYGESVDQRSVTIKISISKNEIYLVSLAFEIVPCSISLQMCRGIKAIVLFSDHWH